MKRQGNVEQEMEHGKNPQEISSLPLKEFRVMIVNMIENLANTMKAQIEKIKEVFNKKLELKNRQSAMNNIITN